MALIFELGEDFVNFCRGSADCIFRVVAKRQMRCIINCYGLSRCRRCFPSILHKQQKIDRGFAIFLSTRRCCLSVAGDHMVSTSPGGDAWGTTSQSPLHQSNSTFLTRSVAYARCSSSVVSFVITSNWTVLTPPKRRPRRAPPKSESCSVKSDTTVCGSWWLFVQMITGVCSMKCSYRYTWNREIVFNSQKLVKRRWICRSSRQVLLWRRRHFSQLLPLLHNNIVDFLCLIVGDLCQST
jgi:hypothetical protein